MKQKHILGLDIGTNSIGWAVINASQNEESKEQLNNINCAGTRIIPMDAAILGDFDKGNSKSQTQDRTQSPLCLGFESTQACLAVLLDFVLVPLSVSFCEACVTQRQQSST